MGFEKKKDRRSEGLTRRQQNQAVGWGGWSSGTQRMSTKIGPKVKLKPGGATKEREKKRGPR